MCRLSDLDGEPCFVGRLGGTASSSDSVLELTNLRKRFRFGLGAAAAPLDELELGAAAPSDSVLELLGRNLRKRFRFGLGAASELSPSELSLSELSLSELSELSCLCAAGARFRFGLEA